MYRVTLNVSLMPSNANICPTFKYSHDIKSYKSETANKNKRQFVGIKNIFKEMGKWIVNHFYMKMQQLRLVTALLPGALDIEDFFFLQSHYSYRRG